jgi:hypothetical protein
MAEFKLGRIRFVWKGAWISGTTYYKDDVVRFGGKTYLCQIGHTANIDFNTDLDISPTKWNLMSDGQRWTGNWTISTKYEEGDLVKYGGSIYICINGHTSSATESLGLEADSNKWETFSEGFDWKGDWTVSTRYKFNDIVRYGGINYICITNHTSAATISAGLEINSSNWAVFTQGQEFVGNWTTGTRYKINDVVKYGAGLWICVTPHTAAVSFFTDELNWNQFVEGLEFESIWNSATMYQPGDIVVYGGNQYVAKTLHQNSNPLTETADWDLFGENLKYQSNWTNTSSYKIGEVVKLNGNTYLATTDSPSTQYTVSATDAITYRFTTLDTAGMVAGMSVRFTGSTFGSILTGGRYYVKTVVNSTEFTISELSGGSTFIPSTGTGLMIATVSAEPPNTNYWSQLTNGFFWRDEWSDDTEYNLGDTVRYGSNAYVCILAHRSEGDDGSTIGVQGGGAANSRPDLDTSGTYWNVINVGSELAVLTTVGDMVYFGGAGPTRLPIGTEGQILRVSSDNIPEWVTWGSTDHVYYVSTQGEDRPYPDCGISLDKPWKTIRYACEQVNKGPRNPNAQHLLELNRAFIQKEITAWIRAQIKEYTVTNPDPSSIWYDFDYNDYKCERDVGFIVDRLIWDLGHGGNLKIRAAAQSFVGALGEDGEFSAVSENQTYTTLSNEYEQGVAAYTYMLDVVQAVLNNQSPTTIYQNVTDDSTAIVSQYINADYTAEPNAYTTVESLVTIVLNALEDQDSSRIPERIVPNNTINIRTGRYRETLPIIVPAETALVGDEVRSVNAGPAGSLISRDDAKYSIGALGRLSAIISDIVTGANVTESTGNIETQDINVPFSEAAEGENLQQLTRTIQHQIDFRLGTLHLENSADPTGFGTTINAGSFVTGAEYVITSLGTTDWNTAAGTVGVTYAVGNSFVAAAVGTGTGTATIGFEDARKLLKENKEFLKAEIIAYIAENHPEVKYSKTACKRDVGYIVDAMVYDLTYGGSFATLVAGLAYFDGNATTTLMIDSSEIAATVDAYGRLKSVIQQIIANTTVTKSTGNTATQWTDTTNLTTGSLANQKVGNLVDIIIDILQGDSTRSLTPQINVTTIATNDTLTSAGHGMFTGDAVIPRITTNGLVKGRKYWVVATTTDTFQISDTFGGTALSSLTNGTGLDIDLEVINYPNGADSVTSTTALITAAETLDAAQETIVQNVIDDLNAVAWHTDFVVSDNNITNDDFEIYVGKGPLAHTYVSGGTVTRADGTVLSVSNFVYNESTGIATVTTTTNHGLEAGDIVDIENITVSCLSTGGPVNFIYPNESSTQGDVTKIFYIQHKCIRDVRIILESVMFDFMFDSNFQTIKSAYSYLRSSAADVFVGGQKQITRDALTNAKTEALANVGGDTTAQGRITSLMQTLDDIIYGATNEGSICQTSNSNADWARLQIERNRNYIVAEIDAWISSTYTDTVTASSGGNDTFTCSDTSWMQRNAAIRFVGTTFGNVAENTTYYIQNVVSSTEFKISLTRDSNTAFDLNSDTGSMTVLLHYNEDLCLRDVNRYLDALKFDIQYPGNYESRLSARYYANAVIGSLEEDMYYLRNGTGVRNQTLEGLTGDLTAENEYGTRRVTAGAYCSLDPGWGPDDFRAWIVGRSPYVQNVTTFGYAAIGQKIDGALHNGGNDSIVSNDFTQVISDGIGAWVTNNGRAELVSVFSYYAHIGYLSENGGRIRGTNGNNSYGDFGSVAEGFDINETPIVAVVDNHAFDASVGSVLTDNINEIYQFEFDNAGQEYTEATWTVSGGGSGAEVVQDEFRDGGVFQVRLLDNVDDSAAAPEVDGNLGGFGYISNANTAQAGTTTQLTLAAVDDEITGAYVGMKLLVTGGTGAGQYGIIASYNAGTKIATVNKESTGSAGWDHIIPGTAIVAPDASSTYVVEPRASFNSPTYSSTARTLATAQTYSDAIYAPTSVVYTSISGTASASGTGASFTVVRRGTKYTSVKIVNPGSAYARLETITLAGTSLGGTSTDNDVTITITAIVTSTGEILDFEYEGIGAGGKFVAVSSGSQNTNTSINGTTWSANATALPGTSNWNSLASGDLTVVETAGSFVNGRGYLITSLGNTVWTFIGSAANLVGTYFIYNGYTGVGYTGTSGTATPVSTHLVAVSSSTTVNAYSTDGGVTWTAGGSLGAGISGTAVSVAYGKNYNGSGDPGTWVVIGTGGATAYSVNGGITWTAGGSLGAGTWQSVAYGQGRWIAIVTGGTTTKYSDDGGVTWSAGGSLPTSTTWVDLTYGSNKFIAVSSDGAVSPAYSVDAGDNWDDADVSGWLNETVTNVSYGQGVFVATNSTSNNMVSSEDGLLWTTRAITRGSGTGFKVAVNGNPNHTSVWALIPSASTTAASSAICGATARARIFVADNKIFAIRIVEPGSAYSAAPTLTITDPNNLYEAPTQVRIGNGLLANPTFVNRGSGYDSAIAELDIGNGYADNFQTGKFLAVKRLSGEPSPGANVVLSTQPNFVYKLVNLLSLSGQYDGAKLAFLQISPDMTPFDSPADGTSVTTRIRYSQVRLTGHDFLDIGTGNFEETNYPGLPTQLPVQANETVDNNGGRVFYTSTDQDGNFRVGELFTIEQSTGVATLNADAFNIAGLSELSLGNITLGGNSATVTEFSTDPFLTANSDSVVPTQRAIKSYIAAQIGGGGASLNVNSIVAGFIQIAGTEITTTTGGTIQMDATFEFKAGLRGYPIAWNYFLNN